MFPDFNNISRISNNRSARTDSSRYSDILGDDRTADYINTTFSGQSWENRLDDSAFDIPARNTSRISAGFDIPDRNTSRISAPNPTPNRSRISDQSIDDRYSVYVDRDPDESMTIQDYFTNPTDRNRNRYLASQSEIMDRDRPDIRNRSYFSNMSRNRNNSTNTSRLSQAEKDRYLANFKKKSEAYVNQPLFRPQNQSSLQNVLSSLNDSVDTSRFSSRSLNDTTTSLSNIPKLSQTEKDRYMAKFKRQSEMNMNKSLFRPATQIERRIQQNEIARQQRWRDDIKRKFGDDDYDNRDYIRWSGRQAYDNDAIDFSTVAGVPKKRVKFV